MSSPNKDQIKLMLHDLAANIEPPAAFEGSAGDYQREWLFAAAEAATELAKAVPYHT